MAVKRMMLVMDKVVDASHIEDVVVGESMLLAAYKFPVRAAATLEFVQRYFL